MPRPKKSDLDFEIHEDTHDQQEHEHEHDEAATDVKDFASPAASALSGRDDEDEKVLRGDQSTLLNEEVDDDDDEEYKKCLPNSALDSNITRASTLVDEPRMDEVKGKIDAMLEDLGENVDDGMTEDSASRRESGVSSRGESRRASNVSDRSRGTGYDEDSVLDHDASVDGTEEDAHTQGSQSRRESAMSGVSQGTSGTVERTDLGSHYDDDEEYDEDSMLEQDEQTSRRESAMSSDSRRHSGLNRRTSGRTEALIHAAARDIVAQINQDRGRQSNGAESLASYQSDSRVSSARPSDVHESVAEESYVSNSKVSSARQSDAHQSVADERSFVSESKVSSARPSDVHESVADESFVSNSRVSSARPSDAHQSVTDERSLVSESKVSSARPSNAHESVADESYVSNSRSSSARPSDAHQSVADEKDFASDSKVSSARPSDVHESVVDGPQTPTQPAEEEDLPKVESRVSSARPSDVHESAAPSPRPSDVHESADEPRMSVEEDPAPVADEAETSSHHENEDDVFSEHSPRSSVGSISESDHHSHLQKMQASITQRMRGPRISDFSRLDDYADEEEEEDFIPTVRGTPRPAFRSPSSVKAMQMSSPTPSVLGSPRSSRRRTPLPTVSRLGSPSVSAQYSPKKTPPRFKRATPPLVLLHATLLPLRWAWAGVLEAATMEELSPEGKGLREAWRALQDRLGDTVCERGILLPHPQNDFEVLEERLLEALELPLRRRARILECGHYLGPSNEMSILEEEEDESEDDYEDRRPSRSSGFVDNKTHWCTTCRSDIRVEDSLGTGKIFRVKVYASNGLMKAGAWEACWKEMERVDVELEPILEAGVQEELGRLAAEQEKALVAQPVVEEEHVEEAVEDVSYLEREHVREQNELPSSPPVDTRVLESPRESLHHHSMDSPRETRHRDSHHRDSHLRDSLHHHHHGHASPPSGTVSTIALDAERRMRDEERLREIYGHTPPTHSAQAPTPQHEDSSAQYMHHRQHHHQSPPSPSAEAYARREERRNASPQRRNESLPELLLAAFRVAMQDRRNVAIVVMSALVLALAMRGGTGGMAAGTAQDGGTFQMGVKNVEVPTVTVIEREAWTRVVQDVVSPVSYSSSSSSASSASTAVAAAVSSASSVEVVASVEEPEPSSYSVEELVLEEETPSSSASEVVARSASESEVASEPSPDSESASEPSSASESESASASASAEPCSSDAAEAAAHEPETVVSERIVRVVETVTEKVVETATVTETQTARVVETAIASAEAEESPEEPLVEEQLAEEEIVEHQAAEEEAVEQAVEEQLVEEQYAEELAEQPIEQLLDGEVIEEPVVDVAVEDEDLDEL